MKKIFIFIFLTKIAYAMDAQEHFILANRIEKTLEEIFLYSCGEFNVTSINNLSKHRLQIYFEQNQNTKNVFWHCGPKTKTFIKRLKEEKYQAILTDAKQYNSNNNTVLETNEEWSKRNSKNKNKYKFLEIASNNEKNNLLSPLVFINALNNVILQDNPGTTENILLIKMLIDEKPYQKTYNSLPDNLKNLLIIHPEKIEVLVKNLQMNDIDQYEKIQHSIAIQKENEKKELEAKKRKEIEKWVNKKTQENNEARLKSEGKANDAEKEKMRSPSFFRSADILNTWKELAKIVELRINKEFKKSKVYGDVEIKILVDESAFEKEYLYHGESFALFYDALKNDQFFILSSIEESPEKMKQCIKIIKNTEDLSSTLVSRFNNYIVSLLEDLIGQKNKILNVATPEDLFSAENGIKYFFRRNKNEYFPLINCDPNLLDNILHSNNNNRIDNLTDEERNWLVTNLTKIMQQRHYLNLLI